MKRRKKFGNNSDNIRPRILTLMTQSMIESTLPTRKSIKNIE